MTSRLKHKLELENINLKSGYLNESFVQIGTPLPALADGKKDKLEYVPEWQQEVRDEKGRRRFHGAFTGGFSAGYYNSVGSKEGWTPATYKSSRKNRATNVQRPEDFMDEEDLAAMKDDRKLEKTETFRDEGFAGMREGMGEKSMPRALESLIAPARTSIGQTLLQKQGWRPGQGIGPRVTLRKLKWQESKLAQAGPSGRTEEEMDIDNETAGKHTFAPRDTKLLVYQSKEDREGLGYQKGMGMGRLPGGQTTGPSFGAADRSSMMEDDDDPYGTGEASSSSLAFAFDNLAEADDDIVVMGQPAPTARPGESKTKQPGATDTWHDGRPVLPGFVLDPLSAPTDKWFEMPEIPEDWRPRPARVWGTTRRWDEQPGAKVEEKEVIRGAPGRPLTFEQRGEALGEEQRVSKAKSVFEYMSEKEKEKLASFIAAAKEKPAQSLGTGEEPSDESPRPAADEVVIPPLSPRTASSALRGYMPYQDDLEKQERYRTYLVSQTYNTKEPNPKLKPSADFDAINKELDDFAASARIFKPMAFAMSSRFTSGSASLASSDLKQAKPGLHVYDAIKAEQDMKKPQEIVPEVKKDMTPREQAADSGMYGRLTREVSEFYPVKLLCKRFGVTDPHPEGKPADVNTSGTSTPGAGLESAPIPKNDASWASAFTHQGGTDAENSTSNANTSADVERAPRSIDEVGMADDINQGRDTMTYTKPSIDIFKAIFASDDEDDSDDENEAEDVKPVIPIQAKLNLVPPPSPPKVVEKPLAAEDLSSFKPVYRKANDSEAGTESKDSEKKKKKDKKKRKGVLSFDVGEDGDDEPNTSKDDRKRKRKAIEAAPGNGDVVAADDTAEGEWVEKPVIPISKSGQRKGAADFM